jgi:hypothetical protein
VEALFGSRETLKTFQPKVILEIVNGGNFSVIKIFANNLNYRMLHIEKSNYLLVPT